MTPSARNRPSMVSSNDRRLTYGWSYHKTGWLLFRWCGTVGAWESFFAVTEKRLRNKMARFIRKQRRLDQTRRSTRHHS